MELNIRLAELQKRTIEHREVLLTEEAARLLQALGCETRIYDPSGVH